MLLDGSEISLAADELVIADASGPVGLAGVMGGDRSGILPGETTNVFLEVAWFAPNCITRFLIGLRMTHQSAMPQQKVSCQPGR